MPAATAINNPPAGNRRGRKPTRYLKRIEDGKILIYTETLAERNDMVECDKHGVPFSVPSSDAAEIMRLNKIIHQRNARIHELEQSIIQLQNILRSNQLPDGPDVQQPVHENTQAEVPVMSEDVAQHAGIEMPQMPSDEDLFGPKSDVPGQKVNPVSLDAKRQEAKEDVQPLDLAPEPEISEEELEEYMPEGVGETEGFDLEQTLSVMESHAEDSSAHKQALVAFAAERYQADLDTRYTADRMKMQIQQLEADKQLEEGKKA